MSNDGTRLLQIAALVIPVIAAAAGGKWAVDATRNKLGSSPELPNVEQLDSLRGYVTRSAPTVQAPASQEQAYTLGGADPFAKVSRAEARSAQAGGVYVGPSAPRWTVSTIMITENRRVAVVNGVLAGVGTILPGGARVLAIEPDHVVLAEAGGARREISVQGGSN